MNTSTARTIPHQTSLTHQEPFRFRAELPAITAPYPPAWMSTATHDFLVPNPRPDLITDPQTLRMLAAAAR